MVMLYRNFYVSRFKDVASYDSVDQFILFSTMFVFTHVGCIAAGVGRAFSHVSVFVSLLFVSLFVRALKGKRLELSTLSLVHIYSIAVA